MDEEMDDTYVEEFLALEIDLDYEFDAARYFDFSKEESPLEAREAEFWFETAKSYPPSPFVAKLNLGAEIFGENVDTSPKPKDKGGRNSISNHSDVDMASEHSTLDESCRGEEAMERVVYVDAATGNPQNYQSKPQGLTAGLTFYNHMEKDTRKPKTKSAMKPSFSRGSTLMKPTASQLAKQNQPRERFQKPLLHNGDRSLENLSTVEIQAAKRQKLEGGHLLKVADTKQQYNLTHKAPKKVGPVDGNFSHAKLKITIPREPELETMHRAQRIRPKAVAGLGEQEKPRKPMFKARPLNRKIFEAPSLALPKKSTPRLPEFQEFHLKTSERAMQHSSAASSSFQPGNKSDKEVDKSNHCSITQNGTTESKRPNSADVPKQEGSETTYKFKARPLNKKIFSSKGDIGVFRNNKREPTVPLEFNFPTNRRFQCNPPVELFNKLSLTTELHQNTTSQRRLPLPTRMPTKGSKENTLDSLQQGHRMIHTAKEKTQSYGFKQTQCGGDLDTEVSTRANISRSLGIR